MSTYIDGYIRRKSDGKKLFEGNFNRIKSISTFNQPFGGILDYESTDTHKFSDSSEDDFGYQTTEYVFTINGFEEAINKEKQQLKEYEDKLRKLQAFEITKDYFSLDEDARNNYYNEVGSVEDSIEFREENIWTLQYYYNMMMLFNYDCDEIQDKDYVELVLWYS